MELIEYPRYPADDLILAVFSDTHSNSTVGLAPPLSRLDDGGYYQQSEFQQKMWFCWLNFWELVKKEKRETNARVVGVAVGDLVDGDHHNTSQIITRNMTYQHIAAMDMLEIPRKVVDDWIVVRGTDVHVGEAGRAEELIGRELRAMQTSTGNFSHWVFRGVFGGVSMDFAHHVSMGRLPWTSANLLLRTAVEIELDYYRAGLIPPTFAVRAHNHRFGDSSFNSPVRVLSLGCWQGLTSFVNKIKPGALPQIGGIIFRISGGVASFNVVNYTREGWMNTNEQPGAQ